MKLLVKILIVFLVICLALYLLLDRGTAITYQNVSDADAAEFKEISQLLEGKPCSGSPITQGYLDKLKAEHPQFDYSLKQGGLIVNGHYFKCSEDGSLKFVDADSAP